MNSENSLNDLFFPNISPKPEDIQCTITQEKEKQQIITVRKLEHAVFGIFALEKTPNQLSI